MYYLVSVCISLILGARDDTCIGFVGDINDSEGVLVVTETNLTALVPEMIRNYLN